MFILRVLLPISVISMVTCWQTTLIQAFSLSLIFFSMIRAVTGGFIAALQRIFYGINLIVNTRTRSMVLSKDCMHRVKIMTASI